MSTTNLRALAVAVAAIIAVLTGAAVGMLSGERTCTVTVTQTAPAVATTTTPPTDASGGGIGNAQPGTTTPGGAEKPVPPPTQNNVQAAPPTTSCTTDSFNTAPALTAFIGAAFVGGVVLLLLLMAARPRTAPSAAPTRTPSRADERATADRNTLVQAAIYVRDRVTSKALADRLGAALRDAGVETLEPTGVRFDPAQHEAGGAAPSEDPSKIGSIAAVEVPGYADRGGRILRAPVVTVYQGGGASSTRTNRTRGEQR